MIGKKIDNEGIIEFRKYWNFEIVEGRLGKPKIKINVNGVDKELLPEQI